MIKDFVTIGLLTYNSKDTIKRALDGLVEQTYPFKEIAIFDDYSTDGTYEICQEYAQRFSFIRLIRNEKNIGVFKNVNQMISHVKGEYFLWACADDYYASDFLEKLVPPMQHESHTIISTCAIKIIYEQGPIISFHYHDFSKTISFKRMAWNVIFSRNSTGELVGYNSIIHTLVRSSYLPKIHYWQQLVFCEQLWVVHALIWGKISYIDEALYTKYRDAIPLSARIPALYKLTLNFSWQLVESFRYLLHFLSCQNVKREKKRRYFFSYILSVIWIFHMKVQALKRTISQYKLASRCIALFNKTYKL